MSIKPQLLSLGAAALFASSALAVPVGPGSPAWESVAIGSNTGSTTYNSSTQTYSMKSKGGDIAGVSDTFQFLYKEIGDNQQLIAKISNFPNNVDWARVGVMVRQNLNAGSAHSLFYMRPKHGSGGQYRASAGGVSVDTWQETPSYDDNFTGTSAFRARYLHPVKTKYLSAVRQGNTVTTYSSDDGKCWNLRTKETPSLSGTALAGVALASNNSTTQVSADVSQLVIRAVPADINFDCARAQRDGPLAAPTSWAPTPTWSVRTTNPDAGAEARTCMAGDNLAIKAVGVDSPLCPMDLASFYPVHKFAGGVGTAGCTGQKNCTESASNDTSFGGFKGIDINQSTGYQWSGVDGGHGGTANLVLRLGATTSELRKMGLWVNDTKVGVISANSANRAEGGAEHSFTATLNDGTSNSVEIRDSESTQEFDVFSLRVERGQPAWMLSGYTESAPWTPVSSPDQLVRVGHGWGDVSFSQQEFWLRTEVNLTFQQKEDLVFYGRWHNSASIYINGVLATTLLGTDKGGTLHYLGMNDAARSALKVGANVIAVRVSCYNGNNLCAGPYAEIGLALNGALARLPDVDPQQKINNIHAPKGNLVKQLAKERGAIGGTYANYQKGELISEVWFGYEDRTLNVNKPMPSKPMMRLASVDKRISDAVTVWMYEHNYLEPEDLVFGTGGWLADLVPLGGVKGTNVDLITVESLRAHRSGITNDFGNTQGWKDRLAFHFTANYPEADAKTSETLTSENLARFFASRPACYWPSLNCALEPIPGPVPETNSGPETYSSNGHSLLRLVQRRAFNPNASYEAILDEMEASEIRLAHERYTTDANSPRPAREPGYMLMGRETRARWVELEEYGALIASAQGLVNFFNRYGSEFDFNGTFIAKAGGQSGAMDGTLAFGGNDPHDCDNSNPLACGSGEAGMWNSDMDGGTDQRFGAMQTISSRGIRAWGSCNPTNVDDNPFRLFNSSRFLSHNSDYSQVLVNNDAVGKWTFSSAGTGQYYIRAAGNNGRYLQANSTGTAALMGTIPSPNNRAAWRLVKAGNLWTMESVAFPGRFLRISNGSLLLGTTQGQWDACT